MDKDVFRATMRDKGKRSKVAAALRDYAERVDQAVILLENELRQDE